MRFASKLIISVVINSVALLLVNFFLPGFYIINSDIITVLVLATVLSLINLIIKPLIKFVFLPLIWATLGAFSLVINISMLYLLDFLSPDLTINSVYDLVIASIIISLFSIIMSSAAASAYKNNK